MNDFLAQKAFAPPRLIAGDANEAIEQLNELLRNFSGPQWEGLTGVLNKRKQDLINALVYRNDDEMRGRIKELEFILGFPAQAQKEIAALSATLADAENDTGDEGTTLTDLAEKLKR